VNINETITVNIENIEGIYEVVVRFESESCLGSFEFTLSSAKVFHGGHKGIFFREMKRSA
jgi:hypothetical protein